MSKKLLSHGMAVILILAVVLSGCGGSRGGNNGGTAPTPTPIPTDNGPETHPSWKVVGSAGFSAGETWYTSIAIDGNGLL